MAGMVKYRGRSRYEINRPSLVRPIVDCQQSYSEMRQPVGELARVLTMGAATLRPIVGIAPFTIALVLGILEHPPDLASFNVGPGLKLHTFHLGGDGKHTIALQTESLSVSFDGGLWPQLAPGRQSY